VRSKCSLKRAQAAMEFLMTYGWAIMAAVIALGVLAYFGVFSPGKYVSGTAVVTSPFYVNAWNVQESGILLELKNNGGESFTIQSVFIEGCGTNDTVMPISTGSLQAINIPCSSALGEGDNFKGDVVIKYRKAGSGLDSSSTGTIAGEVEADGIGGGGCSYGEWTNNSCGEGGCDSDEMNQTRTESSGGAGCIDTSRCIPATIECGACSYNSWTNTGCNQGGCVDEMLQNRTVASGGASCTDTSQCVADASCVCIYTSWVNQSCGDGECGLDKMFQNRSLVSGTGCSGTTTQCADSSTCSLIASAISYWKFDSDFNDVIGGNHGTAFGGAQISGGSLILEGLDDYVLIGDRDDFDFGAMDFTISGWFKTNELGNLKGITGKWGGAPYYYVATWSNSRLNAIINLGSGNVETSGNSALLVGTWYHFAYVVDRSNLTSLYLDAVLQSDREYIGADSGVDVSNDNNFSIGRIGNNLAGWNFNGSIDDVEIWDSALTGTEITQIYDYQKTEH